MLKKSAYLAGRMNHEKSEGHEWRTALTPFLEQLGFEVLDPYQFEPRQLKGLRPGRLPDGMKHWVELRNSTEPGHLDRFLKYMRRIIRFDLHIVKDVADIIIVKWDEGCQTGAGTHAEITVAWEVGKPVYAIEETKMPSWARACCEETFSNLEELKRFLVDEYGVTNETKID